ncbi:hypothetical protein BABINDRAFT_160071 [Babjeviella inositovora NRRL Y-12698]|uniref:ER membrane protein complex subunit 3 n=1 Tax=Babjeviella inositovora NRRL Y-12698 TaxID=984486 RepID=A0A1E3QW00_9ASCO|nr:uncharacterized protein BABINDRAFT_160071 [Babjeviella inositovora NRRL Y-12698]ODQ81840.1 hypothetical protein BABINDRAFT_160071 [Babjeviella inositovora NRRL Y-12698]
MTGFRSKPNIGHSPNFLPKNPMAINFSDLKTLATQTSAESLLTFRQHLQKSAQFRTNANLVLTKAQFETKQAYLIQTFRSMQYLAEPIVEDASPANPLADPNMSDAMYGMIKNNMANYVPQTLIMWWVNFFFAGFVIMKLPFPLTLRFKSMLQNGVMTPDLDVRWVSSISWYFVNLLGLRPIYNLILGDNTITQQMMQTNQPTLNTMPGGPTPEKLFEAELENIQILSYNGAAVFDNIEDRVLAFYHGRA